MLARFLYHCFAAFVLMVLPTLLVGILSIVTIILLQVVVGSVLVWVSVTRF